MSLLDIITGVVIPSIVVVFLVMMMMMVPLGDDCSNELQTVIDNPPPGWTYKTTRIMRWLYQGVFFYGGTIHNKNFIKNGQIYKAREGQSVEVSSIKVRIKRGRIWIPTAYGTTGHFILPPILFIRGVLCVGRIKGKPAAELETINEMFTNVNFHNPLGRVRPEDKVGDVFTTTRKP